MLQHRLLAVGCFAVNELHGLDQLFPWFPANSSVHSGIKRSELPLLLGRQRLHSGDQPGSQVLDLRLRTSRLARQPKVRTELKVLQTEPVSFANHGLELIGIKKLVRIRQIARELVLVLL